MPLHCRRPRRGVAGRDRAGREPRAAIPAGRRRLDEVIELRQPLLAACAIVALARNVLGCPNRQLEPGRA